MKAYHRTYHAASILRDGFRDATGFYLTAQEWTGVWVSDRPLDINEGADGDAPLIVEIPEGVFAAHEWEEEGKPYREALIPAEIVNRYPVSLVPERSAGGPAKRRPRSERIADLRAQIERNREALAEEDERNR